MAENKHAMLKTILIGVVTTVLATTVVYLLGFQNSNRKEKKLRKEATAKAWKEYRQNFDIFSAVMKKLDDGSPDIEKKRRDIGHEMAAARTVFDNIKKEPNIDNRLVTLIDIKTAQLTDFETIMNDFFDEMIAFANQEPTEEEGMRFLQARAIRLRDDAKGLKRRDSIRVATYTDELIKEYKLPAD